MIGSDISVVLPTAQRGWGPVEAGSSGSIIRSSFRISCGAAGMSPRCLANFASCTWESPGRFGWVREGYQERESPDDLRDISEDMMTHVELHQLPETPSPPDHTPGPFLGLAFKRHFRTKSALCILRMTEPIVWTSNSSSVASPPPSSAEINVSVCCASRRYGHSLVQGVCISSAK